MTNPKFKRLNEFMDKLGIDTLLIQRANNFSWLTGGAESYVGIASDVGISAILVTSKQYLIFTTDIEAGRLKSEQNLSSWEFVIAPWSEGWAGKVKNYIEGRFASDYFFQDALDVSIQFAPLRYDLDSQDLDRYRLLGKDSAIAMSSAVKKISKGMSENEIAGLLAQACYSKKLVPIVNLVAVDERIMQFGHPLPTSKVLKEYAMLVLCARRGGLVAAMTRFVHFGKVSPERRQKADACAHVDAAYIRSTQPGASLKDVLECGIKVYQEFGYGDAWPRHHQGGLTGYSTREILATRETDFKIKASQAFAWNPAIQGSKSEDTILLSSKGVEVITTINDWPTINCDGFLRPDILQFD